LGSLFFAEVMITGDIYLSMLANVAIPWLEEDEVEILEQARALSHYSNIVCDPPREKFSWPLDGEGRPNLLAYSITRFDAP
jgi:hypothetical protein